ARFCAMCGAAIDTPPSGVLALQPGQLLKACPERSRRDGAYRIVRRLNKGGMGALYLAKDLRTFGRPCVIKQMLDYYDPDAPDGAAKARTRFAEEGRTLASLSHPGIPKIYAFFEEAGRHYIVMEYIEGDNLAQYVSRVDEAGWTRSGRRLAREQVLRYATQVAQVLEYLAGQPRPVIHQDVKPSNLILERRLDFVRLVDFGTASSNGVPLAGNPNVEPESVYGTVGYAPPEQCQGHPEPRSDVYALGATIYHLLTDDDPRDHPFKFPRMGSLPDDIERVLQRALRQKVEQRITARQLREELEALQNPKRTLQTFAFPTGERIRTVSALPALADEQWEAAREFLYEGDFDRWLRDLNRHDAVLAAESARRGHKDQDAGLEAFLEQLDSGLTRPRLSVAPSALNLGHVARDKPVAGTLTVGNAERGYLVANLAARQPWLDVRPRQVPGHAYTAANVDVIVNTRMLPLRRTPRGVIDIDAGAAGKTSVEVKVQVSVARELWRVLKRTVRGAVPAAGRGFRDGFRAGADLVRSAARSARRQPWAFAAAWLILAVAGGLAWWTRTDSVLWRDHAVIGLAAPPAIALVGALALALLSALIGLLAGAIVGGTRGLLNVERVELPKNVSFSRGLFAVVRWWMGRRR
ncbi:MAG: serine/threonine-protein kinase, partial [Anaerolineae bacterium]